MTDAPAADIVVCTYTAERLAGLRACVSACIHQAEPRDRVIVVVDGDAGLRAQVAAALPEPVVVVATDRRRGLSAARNRGIAAGRAPIVVFIDDDATPRPGWLEALRRGFDHPAVAMVGGAVAPSWAGAGHAPRWFPDEFGWVVGCDYGGMATAGPIRNPIGANMAVRRDVLARVGPFDETVGRAGRDGAGCEETELAIRLRAVDPGATIVRAPASTVDHLVPADRQRIGHLVRRCYAEGRSKARLVRLCGRAALGSETRHATSTLPRSWWAAATAPVREQPWALARAAVGILGLAVATAGFAAGTVAAAAPGRRARWS